MRIWEIEIESVNIKGGYLKDWGRRGKCRVEKKMEKKVEFIGKTKGLGRKSESNRRKVSKFVGFSHEAEADADAAAALLPFAGL